MNIYCVVCKAIVCIGAQIKLLNKTVMPPTTYCNTNLADFTEC